MDRRQLLRSVGLAALGVGFGAGCGAQRAEVQLEPEPAPWLPVEPRGFAPVKVAAEREIRTVVGLRPFRPSGFRVDAESTDNKVIIHNYGHGGGGVTLSWGTAHLARELAVETGHRSCAVIGCGVVGLATARLMQEAGWNVTIYARDLPPHTTSDVAGAQWSPHSVMEEGRTTPDYDDQFVRATRLANRVFQSQVGGRYGVRYIENYIIGDRPMPQPWFHPGTEDLYPDAQALNVGDHPFEAAYARRFTTMLIEPPVYLTALIQDFQLGGGRIVVREFAQPAELIGLAEPVIFNCTGLGARALFGDEELIPIKGQLTVLLPQPEVDYVVIRSGLYMFPRTDGILLGGTRERGEWSLEPNLEAKARILAGHGELFGQVSEPSADLGSRLTGEPAYRPVGFSGSARRT